MKITGIKINEGCFYTRNLKAGTYSFDSSEFQDFYGKNIDIHVIVGKNGRGKSSLLDIAFRLINNFGALLFRDEPRNAADVLNYVLNIKAELHFEKKNAETGKVCQGVLKCMDRCMWLIYDQKVYWLSDEKIMEDVDQGICQYVRKCAGEDNFFVYNTYDKALQKEIANNFFYTVATNYSMLGFLAMDYDDEDSLTYMLPPSIEDKPENYHKKQWHYTRNWIGSLFHKNDGYMCPIVLNPYRDEGQLDMNNEAGLTINRLASLLLSDTDDNSLIDNYRLDELVYKVDWDFYMTFKKGETGDYDLYELAEELRVIYYSEDSYAYQILNALGIKLAPETTKIEQIACLYLVYKVLNIAATYPSYNKYKSVGDINNAFELIPQGKLELVAELALRVKERYSHIEQKTQQTLFFLNRIRELRTKKPNLDLDWMGNPFEYEGYRFFMEYEDHYERIEDQALRLPPPIFKQQILLKKNVKDKISDKERWVEKIPFSKLSSGEKQLLYQLTTIVYHMLNIRSVSEDNIRYTDINIVLDEIEVCFHPDYQRSFVNRFLQILKKLKLNEYFGIHVLMTTHSPFVLSDILKDNILYLNEGKDISEEVEINPLGANINDILFHSFFLDKGFMGDLIKDKLLDFISYLNGEERGNSAYEWHGKEETFIRAIGDPFLRMKLNEKYHEMLLER